jgi:hypothetical protein
MMRRSFFVFFHMIYFLSFSSMQAIPFHPSSTLSWAREEQCLRIVPSTPALPTAGYICLICKYRFVIIACDLVIILRLRPSMESVWLSRYVHNNISSILFIRNEHSEAAMFAYFRTSACYVKCLYMTCYESS